MTRPRKDVVDFYPHYIARGKTIPILEKKYGNDGYAFWWKLLEILGGAEGHYFDCNNPANWEYLQTYTLVNEVIANGILDLLAKLEAIDADLWEKRVVWTGNFIENLKPLYARRSQQPPLKEDIVSKITLSDGLLHTKTPVTGINDNINPHSRVEYSRVEKTRATKAHESEPKAKKPDRFTEFYELYPKHVNRAAAQKSWDKYKFTPEQQEAVITALKNQLAGDNFSDDKKFIAGPEVWLNQRRWENEIIPRKGNGKHIAPARPPNLTDDDWIFYQKFKKEPYGTMEQLERFDLLSKKIGTLP